MIEDDDDALMARVCSRDEAAFSRLVDRHLGPVHRYLVRLSGSAADADELAQETFLRLWQRAASYRPGEVQLTTWLHRIAHNLAVDALRGQRPESAGLEPGVEGDGGANPEHLALSGETGRQLAAAMTALPDNQRSALLLCQVQGFSNREAADIMGVGVRALESLMARGRRALRAALQDGDATSAEEAKQT